MLLHIPVCSIYRFVKTLQHFITDISALTKGHRGTPDPLSPEIGGGVPPVILLQINGVALDDNGGDAIKREIEIGHMDIACIKICRLDHQLCCGIVTDVCKTLHSSEEKCTAPTGLVAQREKAFLWEQ